MLKLLMLLVVMTKVGNFRNPLLLLLLLTLQIGLHTRQALRLSHFLYAPTTEYF